LDQDCKAAPNIGETLVPIGDGKIWYVLPFLGATWYRPLTCTICWCFELFDQLQIPQISIINWECFAHLHLFYKHMQTWVDPPPPSQSFVLVICRCENIQGLHWVGTYSSHAPIANSNVYTWFIFGKVKHDVVSRNIIVEMSSNVHCIHDVHQCPCKLCTLLPPSLRRWATFTSLGIGLE